MMELKPCPFCGKTDKLDFSHHQANNRKTRYGRYDAAIYCRRCGAYGPKIKSEDLALPGCDIRNEDVTMQFRERMRIAALRLWNRRDGHECAD